MKYYATFNSIRRERASRVVILFLLTLRMNLSNYAGINDPWFT